MYLTLEVVSPQAESMGTERRKVVGVDGLSIGRAPGNDWVIADPYISKHHARISYADEKFFVEGLGRNPLALGRSDHALTGNQPRPLSHGDRLFIDQYEILVCVVKGEPPGIAAPTQTEDDPFALIEPGISPTDTATLDPLSVFGGGSRVAEPTLPPVNWQQSSPLADHIDLPSVRATQPSGIPENWDRSGLTHIEAAQSAPVEIQRPRARVQRPPPQESHSNRSSATAATDGTRAAQASRPERPPTQASVTPHATPVPPSADLVELLRGAGLSERELTTEVMHELGKVLRVVVQGVMEVLQARTEIKSQFRLPLTRVKAAENNPLKFSPNVESALHTLLVQRNAGYLSAVPAFEDAFADIRAHQMAMLEGLRAAFESMFASFTPEQLERHFERSVKRSGLLGARGGKSKYWELYVERFEELRGDPDETFRRLFGDMFADAYEKQLERLKSTGSHLGKK